MFIVTEYAALTIKVAHNHCLYTSRYQQRKMGCSRCEMVKSLSFTDVVNHVRVTNLKRGKYVF